MTRLVHWLIEQWLYQVNNVIVSILYREPSILHWTERWCVMNYRWFNQWFASRTTWTLLWRWHLYAPLSVRYLYEKLQTWGFNQAISPCLSVFTNNHRDHTYARRDHLHKIRNVRAHSSKNHFISHKLATDIESAQNWIMITTNLHYETTYYAGVQKSACVKRYMEMISQEIKRWTI